MWDDFLVEDLEKYVGLEVKEDIAEIDVKFAKAYNGYINENTIEDGSGTIDVCICEKKYGRRGEERNWDASHHLFIEIFDFIIESFYIEDNVYGDDGLGDYDPSEVFTEKEYFDQAEIFVRKILKKGQKPKEVNEGDET